MKYTNDNSKYNWSIDNGFSWSCATKSRKNPGYHVSCGTKIILSLLKLLVYCLPGGGSDQMKKINRAC